MKWLEHLKTINYHKREVRKNCFKIGLYRQGLTHDLSKYSPVEFLVGAKYYDGGTHSPNENERRDKGYSAAWLHHKGRNKHHFEYWIDYSPSGEHNLCGMEMPAKYVAEMFCDRVAASKTYQKKDYTDASPWLYYDRSKNNLVLHDNTRALLEKMLFMLKDEGEKKTFDYIKNVMLKKK